MKVWICFALISVVCAKNFEVKDGNATCAMLAVSGSIELMAMNGSTQVGSTVALNFDNATLAMDSTCASIRLNMTKSVLVGFDMSGSAELSVTPTAQFIPYDVFGDQVNISDVLNYEASPLGNFMKNESFRCMAPVNHNFTTKGTLTTYTYSVVATTTDFQVQFSSIANKTFSDGQDCDADKSSTVSPVTKTSTTQRPSTPTPKPKPKSRFVVTEGGKTCVIMDGALALAIPYNATFDGKTVVSTAHVLVPNTSVANGTCDTGAVNSTQKMSIFFKEDWEIQFMFDQSNSDYYISNVQVTYNSKDLLNSTATGLKTVSYNGTTDHYMLASNGGYYQCNSNISLNVSGVMLSSSNFKYAASETNATYSGSVTECTEDEETSSVVPIAVGAALAGLVVIVLIAYLIGRRRSRAAGYESV